ncbi:helix-turn-helix domain-containing protein [Hujiaoplasma nucleasis]|uniref:Helix-turn-helix domain-containing protein n=1 Tax=Hujiaoplasma nucleasis TaxID=2725268 RepID=A0A7L6N6E4_9MOLU|nr:Fic family protein [Hujiaoplasma nucleasis]QLY40139.1 helix-turn-helix domain-containing protein [Hujiaoplasma nucleasis]
MSIVYKGLFEVLSKKNISISEMSKDLNISSATQAKFRKGEYVSLQTLESICKYLSVGINDIVSFLTVENSSILYQRLREEMSHKIKGSIYHETQILLTYNSNHIEGSQLSPDQTRYIFETNTIKIDKDSLINVDDIIETQNHFRCIDYMIESTLEPLSESLIKDLHRILKTGTSDAKLDWFIVGEYKQRPNTVGGIATTKPVKVQNELISLIGKYENKKEYSFEDIIEFHYQFECIHPFQDGNGRVGRLIAFKECLRHGFAPFTIDESIKLFYYRGLKEWKSDKGYLIDTCLSGQDKYKKLLDMFNISYE